MCGPTGPRLLSPPRCVVMPGMPFPSIRSPELQKTTADLDHTLVSVPSVAEGHQAPKGFCQHSAPGPVIHPAPCPGQAVGLDLSPCGSQSHLCFCHCCCVEVHSCLFLSREPPPPRDHISHCLLSAQFHQK
nr:ATP-dependent DNA helicase DDX11-like [Pan paniscus]